MNQADITANGFDYDDEYDEYDDATSKNPHPSDSQAAIGDTDTAADNNTTTTTTANPSTDAVGSAPSTKKRTTIDESALSAEDLQKLESRRAYNRQCAAKARKRSKTLVAQLQAQVEELTKDKAELKRSNTLMRTQLDLLEQQNRTLLMNQSSSSQMNVGGFMPGGSAMPSNPSIGAVASMSGGNPLFNLGSSRYGASGAGTIGSGSSVVGANNLSNASTSFLGVGTGGGGGSFGQLSLLDRLRLQQQIQHQQQQQQQLGLMASSSGGNSRRPLSDEDVVPNNLRNNNNAGIDFMG